MFRQFWPVAPALVITGLAALAFGADQPSAALIFSALMCIACAIPMALPGARISFLGVAWLVGGFLLFLTALFKGWASTGAGEYASLMAGAGVFLVARDAALKPERATVLLRLILALGAGIGFIAFLDFVLDPDTLFGLERAYHQTRLSGPFLSANTAATFYGMIALLALSRLMRSLERDGPVDARIQRLAFPAATLLICASCLFLSGSRAGISLFMATAILLVAWDRAASWRASLGRQPSADNRLPPAPLWRRLAGPGLLIMLVVLVFGVSGGLYADRISQGGLMMGEDPRAVMFARYLDAIWLYPGLGSGLGGFEFINDFLAQAGDARMLTNQNAAHNIAFQWLIQTGLVASLVALALLALIVSRVFRGLSRRRSQTLILRGCVMVTVFVLAHGMVDYALEIPAVFWLFSIILGLGVGVAEGGRSGRGARSGLPARIGVTLALILTAGLSIHAGLDRVSALSVSAMPDREFSQRFSANTPLTGSPVRLEAIGDRALRLETPDLALARLAFQASLVAEPRNGKVWAKAAYVNYAIIPVVAGETEDALRQSYYLMPYADRSFISWRLDFVATAWTGLPQDLRDAAEREARTLPGRPWSRWRNRVGLAPDRERDVDG